MPRVLLLARSFPPLGGAGVHRTLGTVRYLPDYGYEPVLVTGTGQWRGRWDAQDPVLAARVPAGAEVNRVPGEEPSAATGLAERLGRLRPGPDRWVRWWIAESVRLGRRVGAGADIVLVSCAPYETALAGARLAAELGVPWVADLEDPWALDEMRPYPTALHGALDLRSMRRALAGASAIVTAAPEAAVAVRSALPELGDRPIRGIPIGFEREDFTGPAATRGDGVFRLVHAGSLHTELAMSLRRTRRRRRLLGGFAPGVNVLTRSHVPIMQAVERLLDAEPALRGKFELQLAGALTEDDHDAASGHDFVRTTGVLTHDAAVALMRSADLLFLPMHDVAPGTRARLIPYKTYEYLGAQRPILAAVPDGDVRDMLAPVADVTLVRPGDIDGIVEALRAEIARAPVTRAGDGLDSPAMRRLDRRRCVADIAAVLDEVLRSRGSRPTT